MAPMWIQTLDLYGSIVDLPLLYGFNMGIKGNNYTTI